MTEENKIWEWLLSFFQNPFQSKDMKTCIHETVILPVLYECVSSL